MHQHNVLITLTTFKAWKNWPVQKQTEENRLTKSNTNSILETTWQINKTPISTLYWTLMQHYIISFLLAMWTAKEHCLAFISRSSLPCGVCHAFMSTVWTFSVSLQRIYQMNPDHQLRKLLIVTQILLVSTLVNVQRAVWRIWILMLGYKGLGENLKT